MSEHVCDIHVSAADNLPLGHSSQQHKLHKFMKGFEFHDWYKQIHQPVVSLKDCTVTAGTRKQESSCNLACAAGWWSRARAWLQTGLVSSSVGPSRSGGCLATAGTVSLF